MAPRDTPREPFKFDYSSLPAGDRSRFEAQAHKTLHMEPGAGRIQAGLMLDAKAKIEKALEAARKADVQYGFNPQLSTGSEVTSHYDHEVMLVIAELMAASAGCTHMANEFLAMEYAYLTTEANNATRYEKWKDPQGNDTTQIEI